MVWIMRRKEGKGSRRVKGDKNKGGEGEEFDINGLHFRVIRMNDNRIEQIYAKRMKDTEHIAEKDE